MVALTYEKDLTVKAKVSSSSSRAVDARMIGRIDHARARIFLVSQSVRAVSNIVLALDDSICWSQIEPRRKRFRAALGLLCTRTE